TINPPPVSLPQGAFVPGGGPGGGGPGGFVPHDISASAKPSGPVKQPSSVIKIAAVLIAASVPPPEVTCALSTADPPAKVTTWFAAPVTVTVVPLTTNP